jgi:hypothetical protein
MILSEKPLRIVPVMKRASVDVPAGDTHTKAHTITSMLVISTQRGGKFFFCDSVGRIGDVYDGAV